MIKRKTPHAGEPRPEDPSALAPDVLGQLQAALIDAVLSGTPLAGQSRALSMPDRAQLVGQSPVVLSSDNLGGPLHLKQVGAAPLQILSAQAIQQRAKNEGGWYYLRFEPPQPVANGVRLTLQLQAARSGQGGMPNLGMSAVQVSFEHTRQGWRALDDSAALSS